MQGNIFSNIYCKISFSGAGLLKRNNQVIYFYSHCILRTNNNDKDKKYFWEMTAELWDVDNSGLGENNQLFTLIEKFIKRFSSLQYPDK